ncbi:MAG: serine hydrolase domain-containing protein, partial [Bacteroidota bacterium]
MMIHQGLLLNPRPKALHVGLSLLLTYFMVPVYGQNALGQMAPFTVPDSLFENWEEPKDPGGLVMVLQGDEVLFQRAYGMAHLGKRLPNQLDQAMSLASVSKQFTATCIVLLEEQGKLAIEDPITKYYPEFQAEREIKIRNLLNHSSGLRDGYVLALLTMGLRGIRYEQLEPKKLVAMVAGQSELNFEPDSEFAYTNTNYVLLADLVERVSGLTLREYADSAIFQPLGMSQTYFNDVPGASGPEGYLQKKPGKFRRRMVRGGVVGDSHLVSTLPDLARWEANMWNNRLGKGSPELIRRMWTPLPYSGRPPTGYGYGVVVEERDGMQWVSHGGDNDIQTSIILRNTNARPGFRYLPPQSGFPPREPRV